MATDHLLPPASPPNQNFIQDHWEMLALSDDSPQQDIMPTLVGDFEVLQVCLMIKINLLV